MGESVRREQGYAQLRGPRGMREGLNVRARARARHRTRWSIIESAITIDEHAHEHETSSRKSCSVLFYVLHRIPEHTQPNSLLRPILACPTRMVRAFGMRLGVRHQSKHAARRIA